MQYAIAVYVYACAYLGVAIFKFISRWKEFDSFWPTLAMMLLCLIIGELLVVWVVVVPLAVVVTLAYLKVRTMIDNRRRARERINA